MSIIERIDKFAVDIYFLMPSELLIEYQKICELFVEYLERYFSGNSEVNQIRDKLLGYLLTAMESKDFTKMADAMKHDLKPFIIEIDKIISKQESVTN